MKIRKRTKETKGANRIFVVVGNELGEEYKGDEVDEKIREMKGMKEITRKEEGYEGDQIDNRYKGVKRTEGTKVLNGIKRGKRGQSNKYGEMEEE